MANTREHWLKIREDALKKHMTGKRLTLEETSAAMWNPDGCKAPMSCMGILKIENRALAKLKIALKKYHIDSIDDLFEPKYREFGKPISSVYE